MGWFLIATNKDNNNQQSLELLGDLEGQNPHFRLPAALDKLKSKTTRAALALSPWKAAAKAASITNVVISISPFCKETTACGRIPHRPSSSASSRKMSPVTGKPEHNKPNSMRTPEISTIKWRLCQRIMSQIVGVTGLISKLPCPSKAAPNPVRFNFAMTKSGVVQCGQCTKMQIFWKVLMDTLSTPGSGVTILSIKRTSESQQMLRTINRVLTLIWSLHSPMVVGLNSTCSVCVQQAQESCRSEVVKK